MRLRSDFKPLLSVIESSVLARKGAEASVILKTESREVLVHNHAGQGYVFFCSALATEEHFVERKWGPLLDG